MAVPALLAALAPLPLPAAASAQEVGVEAALHAVQVGQNRVYELAIPFGAGLVLGPLRLDVNSAYARARLEREGERLELDGVTDVTARAMVTAFGDRTRFLFAANLPAGSEPLTPEILPVAAAIGTELLTLPVAGFGSGLGFTGATALAQPLGPLVLGVVLLYRRGSGYDAIAGTAGGTGTEFRPGDEGRARLALEWNGRSGRAVRLAGTYSRLAADESGGAPAERPGDRLMTEASADFPLGRGAASIYGWSLYRGEALALAGSPGEVTQPARILTSGGLRLTLPMGAVVTIRPATEATYQKTFEAPGFDTGENGFLARAGLGLTLRWGGRVLEPVVLAQYGKLEGEAISGLIVRLGAAWARP